MRTLLFIGLTLLGPPAALADIYKHVDESGRVTYSNLPLKNGKKLDLPDLSTLPPPKSSATITPADFPKVDNKTQKSRDEVRRRILADELSAESKALVDALAALKEGEAVRLGDERNYQKYLDRIQGLKDTVALHEKNVAAIQRELDGGK